MVGCKWVGGEDIITQSVILASLKDLRKIIKNHSENER
jgi:hypothetical protein